MGGGDNSGDVEFFFLFFKSFSFFLGSFLSSSDETGERESLFFFFDTFDEETLDEVFGEDEEEEGRGGDTDGVEEFSRLCFFGFSAGSLCLLDIKCL